MTFKEDINARINADFGESADLAKNMLFDAIENAGDIKTDRVIRCILFLAKGSLVNLARYIGCATEDTRDVMLWAEYEGLKETEQPCRVRDFNKTFDESSNDVKE